MLITGLFILLLVSAVSHERINGRQLSRAATLVLFYAFILSINTLNVSIIGSGIGILGGLYQVTVVSKIIECFIYLIAAMILANTIAGQNERQQAVLSLRNPPLSNRSIALENGAQTLSEYPIIALFTVVGGVLLISSNDLVSMYLSIELQSFGLYVLATISRDSQSATYAGLKYFLLGGLSSGFILLGSSILYAYTGITNLEEIYLLISGHLVGGTANVSSVVPSQLMLSEESLNTFKFIELGVIVMVVGFLFKIASAPFHNWAPDVYDGVPTKVTTWLAIMAKIAILTFLLDLTQGIRASMAQPSGTSSIESTSTPIGQMLSNDSTRVESFDYLIEAVTEPTFASSLGNLLLICSLLSLLIGTIVGLAQYRIKRLLSYSTISHVGFLLLAIAINTEDSIESFIFYLIQYSLTSANAFFVLIAFGAASTAGLALNENQGADPSDMNSAIDEESLREGDNSPIQFISQLKGQFSGPNASPLLALAMAVTLFSMAGIPPLVGFFAKQAVLLAAVKNGFVFLALVGIVTSVISAAYYLRVIKVMHFDSSPHLVSVSEDSSSIANIAASPEISQRDQKILDSSSRDSFLSGSSAFLAKSTQMSNSLSFSISLLTLLTLLFVLKPTLILNSAHIMALSLFYI